MAVLPLIIILKCKLYAIKNKLKPFFVIYGLFSLVVKQQLPKSTWVKLFICKVLIKYKKRVREHSMIMFTLLL